MRSMAAPNNSGDTKSPESEKSAPRSTAAFGAIRTLRILLVGTIIVPLLLAAIGGYFSYQASYHAAGAALAEAVAVAQENTTKILDTHMLVAARIDDLLTGVTDPQLRAQEKTLHERIARQIEGLRQVAAAWVIGANGRELVSARVFPVNRDLDHSGREDFRTLRDARLPTFIWALRARSLGRGDFQPYFTVSQRRQAPDDSFRGIIVVAVSGAYVASFYNSLLGGSAQYAASVLLADGKSLAHYPESAEQPESRQRDDVLAAAIAAKTTAGLIASGSPFSRGGRLVAYERLANYPVYVTIERTRASIVGEWLENMAGYAAIGVPAAIGLMLLSLLALRRTRREQRALAEARDAIAERAAIEAQLHQAQKMEAVGLLTSGIAHDFNNLLTAVIGNLEMARVRAGETSAVAPLLKAALQSAGRGAALIQDLLAFARKQSLDPRSLDLGGLVSGIEELLRRTLGPEIRLVISADPDLAPAHVDANQVELAILNLTINARDAMPEGGTMRIALANRRADRNSPSELAPGDYVVVSISDDGTGMDEATLAQAFDPFFTTKEIGSGSGLGLPMVHGFSVQSGGTVRIRSKPGEGTTVELWLPQADEPASGKAGDRSSLEIGRGTSCALLCDDDDDVRPFLSEFLRSIGYIVHEASGGEAAIHILESRAEVDLLIVDYAIPGLSGIETIRQARLRRPDLRSLLITGHAGVPSNAGVPLLRKPFAPDELAQRVAEILAA